MPHGQKNGERDNAGFNYKGISSWILDNIVTILFVVFVLYGFSVSEGISIHFFLTDLNSRIFRNTFLVLSLIIPVLAGLGLNFGIVIGAMSAQAAVAIVRYFHYYYPFYFGGMVGLVWCWIISFFIAAFCGYLTGKLYNKTRGQEMIASLIVGFFANGVYQFFFLFVVGVILKVPATHPMIKPDGVGIRMTVDLVPVEKGGLKYVLDNIYQIPFVYALLTISLALLAMFVIGYCINIKRGRGHKNRPMSFGFNVLMCLIAAGFAFYAIAATPKLTSRLNAAASDLTAIASSLEAEPDLGVVESELNAMTSALEAIAAESNEVIAAKLNAIASEINSMIPNLKPNILNAVASIFYDVATKISAVAVESSPNAIVANLMQVRTVPVATGLLIIGLCMFTWLIMKTKLGQDFRSVGQSQHIAEVSGINVDRTRIIATMISTVLAAWGQLIYLQNMGTLNTYGAHTQIGMFSVAALLVGGASTSKASVRNAVFGTILFNAMFIMSPVIGKSVFGNAALGEYFRTFMVYGVIGLALGLYVWEANKKNRIVVE